MCGCVGGEPGFDFTRTFGADDREYSLPAKYVRIFANNCSDMIHRLFGKETMAAWFYSIVYGFSELVSVEDFTGIVELARVGPQPRRITCKSIYAGISECRAGRPLFLQADGQCAKFCRADAAPGRNKYFLYFHGNGTYPKASLSSRQIAFGCSQSKDAGTLVVISFVINFRTISRLDA